MIKTITKKGAMGVALACALTLACGPAAFGDPAAGTSDQKKDFTNGSAESTLAVLTDATQLSADVPLNVTVVADVLGGDFKQAPSDGKYKITNKSYFDIVVSDIAAKAKSNDWSYSNTSLTASASTSPTGAIGDINITLKPGTATAATTIRDANTVLKAGEWEVPAATASKSGELAMAVGGSTSVLKKSIGEMTASEAVTITYTIEPATATA
ncbi:hypothetical protein [Gordonibacter massiliensis (ex Traore et al. 2017)]|uniref:WxL domain-containing protein n=1 Tax=Gordonibacter massiliensis (ex Traore et al. 2017) TaxID=1841863 RepID=A0A842JNS1_9ACTN|nr:hypothetical protein [Gordonibacter massiliensis (ex Traore et al. 2017)]MBC2890769.1 hypothetical protein [Gordonibacter massiliensis (ex Traore et al. 2017)]